MRRLGLPVAVLAGCVAADPRQESERLLDQARALYLEANYEGAARLYGEAVAANPKNAPAYFGRANANIKIGDSAQNPLNVTLSAIEDYSRAIELFPAYHDAIFNRAMAFAAIGRYREAVADLRRVAEGTELRLRQDANRKLGEILADKYTGRDKEALASLERYVELGGPDPAVRAKIDELKEKMARAAQEEPAVGLRRTAQPEADSEAKAAELVELAVKSYAAKDKDAAWAALLEVKRRYPNTRAARDQVPKLAAAWEPPR